MKFKDKSGNIFVPTNPRTEEEMKNSKFYEEVKEKTNEKTNENKEK